ncbi:hypothetical protein SAMN05421780_11412 [Flexibacter flexilis DSM 6793]|uniref:Uncharacterized protein n=1 Tax=Flexibacter flexilis DSM 6793 TaxID=927664 RepID=A0A1I1NDF9_9BACT|nr:hypothetical protein [Flexibacter flexilis]SFC95272.1 hypothetical protein SAMN05421780_11412 [Flexibacter flexilis DSM 6793]
MSLNLTTLSEALGAYYRQKKADITSKLYTQEDARKYFTKASSFDFNQRAKKALGKK